MTKMREEKEYEIIQMAKSGELTEDNWRWAEFSQRDKTIFFMRFRDDMTYKDIGSCVGLSSSRVMTVCKQVLWRLQYQMYNWEIFRKFKETQDIQQSIEFAVTKAINLSWDKESLIRQLDLIWRIQTGESKKDYEKSKSDITV